MRKRVFKYGDTRRAKVLDALDVPVDALVCVDELGEGHIILGGTHDAAEPGAAGTLTFMRGGPTGGWWRFTRDAP